MIKFSARSILPVVLFVLMLLAILINPRILVDVDNKYFNESIRQVYGKYVEGEDWSSVPVLPADMNYQWMESGGGQLRIGHALGFASTPLANELGALPLARVSQLKVLEVDLWLAADGSIRCFHGPGDPGPLLNTTCTLERLVRATEAGGEYLVLDIKTDFDSTASKINALLKTMPGQSRRLIYQLYRPGDVRTFASFPDYTRYAGPILTAYISRSSLNELARASKRANIRAFTVPMQRQSALDRTLTSGIGLFVHPVHDCADLHEAKERQYGGIYVLASLRCQK